MFRTPKSRYVHLSGPHHYYRKSCDPRPQLLRSIRLTSTPLATSRCSPTTALTTRVALLKPPQTIPPPPPQILRPSQPRLSRSMRLTSTPLATSRYSRQGRATKTFLDHHKFHRSCRCCPRSDTSHQDAHSRLLCRFWANASGVPSNPLRNSRLNLREPNQSPLVAIYSSCQDTPLWSVQKRPSEGAADFVKVLF